MTWRPSIFRVPLFIGVLATLPAGASAQSTCDRACLTRTMQDFLQAMLAHRDTGIALVEGAEIRENTRIVPLAATTWTAVREIKSQLLFADPLTGNVLARTGVELGSGRPAYLSTRLKVIAGGRISDVEISADTSSRVVPSYVFSLDTVLTSVLPEQERMSRDSLDALGRRYFQALTSHDPVPADFDDRCDRFHSGQRITNTANNSVEGGPPRTCLASNQGNRPWGPAIEQRFPIIDEERGIVIGYTLLLYPNDPRRLRMYVSEVFKVRGRRIVLIDNIGLMMPNLTTLGFAH